MGAAQAANGTAKETVQFELGLFKNGQATGREDRSVRTWLVFFTFVVSTQAWQSVGQRCVLLNVIWRKYPALGPGVGQLLPARTINTDYHSMTCPLPAGCGHRRWGGADRGGGRAQAGSAAGGKHHLPGGFQQGEQAGAVGCEVLKSLSEGGQSSVCGTELQLTSSYPSLEVHGKHAATLSAVPASTLLASFAYVCRALWRGLPVAHCL